MDVVADGDPHVAGPSLSSTTTVVACVHARLRPRFTTRLRPIAAWLAVSQILASPGRRPAHILAQTSTRAVNVVLELSRRAVAGTSCGLVLPARKRLLASSMV